MQRRLWTFSLAFGLLAVAAPARAGEVMCEDENGKCTVGNEPDSVSCACGDEAGGGGTGGNEWEGLSDEELMEICLAELEFCGLGESDTGEGTSTTGEGTSTGVDADGDDGMDDGVDGTGTSASSTSASTGESDADGESEGTGDEGTGGEGTADAGSDADGGMEETGTGGGEGGDTEGDASSSTGEGGDAGGDASDEGSRAGCGCFVDGARGAWSSGLAALALLGLRRRRVGSLRVPG